MESDDARSVAYYCGVLKEYISVSASTMVRGPSGRLSHPYVVPSSQGSRLYSDTLWDWDSWLTSVALGQVELDQGKRGAFFDAEAGSLRNFLECCGDDGVVPILLFPDEREFSRPPVDESDPFSQNMHKPVLAQATAMLVQRRGGECEWAADLVAPMRRFLDRYLTSHTDASTGLAYWQSDFAVGVDNDPSVFYRPDQSCASIYLNSLLYRELLAFGFLQEALGDMDESIRWRRRAQRLATAVNRYCWDRRDETYYSVDLALRPVDESDWLHHGAPRDWPCLLLRIDSWSSFLPLWAGVASEAQAASMVRRLQDKRTFWANYGVRTLSALEQQYSLTPSNNPSCWLGPIWVVSNYLVFSGLIKYGYRTEAQALAQRTVILLARDVETSGGMHEYYNPDTGEPIITAGFENWNLLVLVMVAFLEGRPMSTEF